MFDVKKLADGYKLADFDSGKIIAGNEGFDAAGTVFDGELSDYATEIVASKESYGNVEEAKDLVLASLAIAKDLKSAVEAYTTKDFSADVTAASFGGEIVASNERFDQVDFESAAEANVTINASVYSGYEFSKVFYQPRLLKGSEVVLKDRIELPVTYNRVILEGTSTVESVKEESIFNALRQSKKILDDKFRLIPDASDADKLAVLVAGSKYTLDGVLSAPVKAGEEVDLITISKATNSLVNGEFTSNSTIGPGARLENIVLKADDGTNVEYVAMNVVNDPNAAFVPTRNGDSDDLFVATTFDYMMVKFGSVKVVANNKLDGTDSVVLADSADIPAGTTARLALEVKADMNTRFRTFKASGVSIVLKDVRDASGALLDPSSAVYGKVKEAIAKLSFAGFTVKAYHRDLTRNITSNVLDVVTKNDSVMVTPRDGASTIIASDGTFDKTQIGIQAGAIKHRIEVEAIETTKAYFNLIKSDIEKGVPLTEVKTAGLGRYIINAQVFEDSVDMNGAVDAQDEIGKIENGGALLANKIGLAMASAITKSRLKASLEFINGVSLSDAKIAIGTTDKVAALLRKHVNTIAELAGVGGVELVATALEEELKENGSDIAFCTLVVPGKPDHLLTFGRMLFKPFVTGVVTRSANGTVKELYTKPFYTLQPKLPLLFKLVVENIDGVGSKRVYTTLSK